jgi:hemin uptake protein HemP
MSFHGPMSETPKPDADLPRPTTPVYDATKLTGPDGTALIVLDDKTYTLRITRAGKLILTK